MVLATKMSRKVLNSIRDPVDDIDKVVSFMGEVKPKSYFVDIVLQFHFKSSPYYSCKEWFGNRHGKCYPAFAPFSHFFNKGQYASVKSPFLAQTFELAAFQSLLTFVAKEGEGQGVLWPKRVRYAFDCNKTLPCF